MELVNKTASFVTELLVTNIPDTYTYHNISHTREVVAASRLIGKKSGLSDEELTILTIAAWFHDTGFVFTYNNHEDASIAFAKQFLESKGLADKSINKVVECIEATKIANKPESRLSEILCDADLYNLSQNYFYIKLFELQEERRKVLHENMENISFWESTYGFLLHHSYFSGFGQHYLQNGKKRNVELLNRLIVRAKLKEQIEQC